MDAGVMVRSTLLLSLVGSLVGVWGCAKDASSDETTDGSSSSSASSSGGATEPLPEGCAALVSPGMDDPTTLQAALLDAMPGDTVCMAEGTFKLNTEISISADNVTLKGASRDTTILDFSTQNLGANGMKISGDGVTLLSFTVKNTPGDGIRGDDVKNITYDDVAVIWEAEASLENGAYGFYPVGCDGVVIRNSLVVGARDAGIYVGQSTNIIVEDSEAYGNVAGIEIENSTDATVRRNHAHDNAGGILIFNLPGLPVKDGKRTLAYENIVDNNNGVNFGEPGTAVSQVPSGTGFMILACDDNELRNNQIRGNNSTAVVIVEYTDLLFGDFDDPEFNVYAEGNWVHDNEFANNGTMPAELIAGLVKERPVPDLFHDGCFDAAADNGDGKLSNCFSDNGAATYINIDLCNGFMMQSTDITPVTCEHTPLMAPT
jgi:parallel beta-helix repeat protein